MLVRETPLLIDGPCGQLEALYLDVADARGVVLTPTRSGRALFKRVMRLIEQRNADIFDCLSATEKRQLETFLDRLIHHSKGQGQVE